MKRYLQTIPFILLGLFLFFLTNADVYAKDPSTGNESALQEVIVKGIVTSSMEGVPLPGVNILEKGTMNGTVTDANGKYTLTISSANAILVFSYIGYLSEEVPVEGRSVIDMTLAEKIEELGEVVVVGYGTTRKSDLTSAVASVNMKEMQKLSATSLEQGIQGRAAGVYVTQKSGKPGEAANIYIRGPGSINGTDPLWVVDGIPIQGQYDQSDIESIEVLKDASSAAIYGARGANGVILVTTRRGKEGKPSINFSTYQGITNPLNVPDLVNSYDYAKYKDESFVNGGFPNSFVYHSIAQNPDTLLPVSTDWMDELFHNGSVQNYTLDFSGGNKVSRVYSSISYLNQRGTYYKTSYERITVNFNTDNEIKKWLKIGNSLNLSFSKTDPKAITDETMLRVNPFMKVMDETLTHPYTHYGQLTGEYGFQNGNPIGIEDVESKLEKSYRVVGSIYVDVNPFKGLTWRTSIGANLSFLDKSAYISRYDFLYITRDKDRLENNLELRDSYVGNSVLTYNFTRNRHSLTAMAGFEIIDEEPGHNYNMSGEDVQNGKITYTNTDITLRTLEGDYSDNIRWASGFGRLFYNFSDKYLFTFNIRADGTSKFARGNKIGVFPSGSAAWRITKEEFMSNIARFADLKLRFGYGVVGNASFKDGFPYLATLYSNKVYYVLGNNYDISGLRTGMFADNFANEELIWESVYTTNAGFDLLLFHNRLEINADYYLKNTKDMLIPVNLPNSAGLGSDKDALINVGKVNNSGVDVQIRYKGNFGAFSYSVGGNISYNKTEVLSLNADDQITTGELSQFYTAPGLPMSSYQGYIVEGIWQATAEDTAAIVDRLITANTIKKKSQYNTKRNTAPGDLIYSDLNGDGLINKSDMAILGDPWPKYVYGLNFSGDYKGFDMTIFLQGVLGNEIYNLSKRVYENTYGDYSFTNEISERWTPDNPSNTNPRLAYGDPNKNLTTSSSYFVEDGSYMRVKNLVIGYTLPQQLVNKIGFVNCRIYLSGQNLLTFTKYTGMDPEIGGKSNVERVLDNGIYPQSRTYMVGLQVSL
jgi:TonB-linked SusC/RagA family outer membrane protein